ncbi:MAG: hypothetical protein AB1631_01650 [Acidobacteriota bacterium]
MKKAQTTLFALTVLSLFITSAAGRLFSSSIAARALPTQEDDDRFNTFAATETNRLVCFDINKPEEILRQMPITGLQEGEKINSLLREGGFRGGEGEILMLAATNQGRFYFVNTVTGLAFQIAGIGSFRLFIGEAFDIAFLPQEGSTQSGAFSPAGEPDGPSILTHDVVAVTPDGDKIVSDLILKALKGSIHLAYKEFDRNFGKQPLITDVHVNSIDGQIYGVDTNQNVTISIGCDGSISTLSSLCEDEELCKDKDLSDPESGFIDFETRSMILFLEGAMKDRSGVESVTTQRIEAAAEDETETEIFVFNLETGDAISIGSVRTDSGIRAVAFAREFKLDPDYTISAEPAITVKRGETLRNFRINIIRWFDFEGNVTVNSPDVLPDKVKVKPGSRSTSGDSVSFKKIQVKGAAQPGTYPLEFTATDETGRVRKTTVNLVIE